MESYSNIVFSLLQSICVHFSDVNKEPRVAGVHLLLNYTVNFATFQNTTPEMEKPTTTPIIPTRLKRILTKGVPHQTMVKLTAKIQKSKANSPAKVTSKLLCIAELILYCMPAALLQM